MPASRGRRYRLPKESRKRGAGGARWPAWLIFVAILGAALWGWLRKPIPPRPGTRTSPGTNTLTVVPAPPVPRRIQIATNLHRWAAPPTSRPPDSVHSNPSIASREAPPASGPRPGAAEPPGDAEPWIPRSVTNLLESQIALASHGINGGSIDGAAGAQFSTALRAFQLQSGLEQTGRLDRETLQNLRLERPPFTTFTVVPEHLERLTRIPSTWLGKSDLAALDFESLLELVAEHSHSHPNLVRQLNPRVDWNAVPPGTVLLVPDAGYPPPRRAARMRVSLAGHYLRAFDERGELLCHFPCSIGRIAAKRPVGGLHVAVLAKDPNYTMDPKVFPESAEAQSLGRKLVIPPGPNNPVGVAWLGLDRPGYGIHGTPGPELVGRTESHGCFRLANWNAEYLRQMAWVGMPVSVEP